MNILVTGSSGWLGQTLVPRLQRDGHRVVGLDPVASATTTIVGSIAERDTVKRAVVEHEIDAIVHGGALHKPDIARRTYTDFLHVNVEGTLNLLQAAVDHGVQRFVFTSTTSLMISKEIRAGKRGGAARATWIDESMAPLLPRNIYGVSKLSAEQLCRLFAERHGLPVIVLRTARFFPEEDDMAHRIAQSGPNTKLNEFLFRRLTVEDAAEAHVVALEQAPKLGWGTFIVSAPTPFTPDDCEALIHDAPTVVARYFPEYRARYAPHGYTMFDTIDRIYDASKAERVLGFRCRTDFAQLLAAL